MADIDKDLINRINVLAKKSKDGSITDKELEEQKALRSEYIKQFKKGFKQQLQGIKVVDEKGNDVTPKKLRRKTN